MLVSTAHTPPPLPSPKGTPLVPAPIRANVSWLGETARTGGRDISAGVFPIALTQCSSLIRSSCFPVFTPPLGTHHQTNPCQQLSKMADKLAFLLFGDQSLDTHGFLAEFFRQGKQGLLAKAFLEQVAHALRKEVNSLGALERSRLPTFRTLRQLNEKYHAQSLKHPGIDGALLCISQLAHYIE